MNAPATRHADTDAPATGLLRKFVRVQAVRDDGLVSFDFAIGWPDLSVELMLPGPAFEAFCATHRVERLDGPADGR
ncbi:MULTISPECIES: phenol hydroxylase subunit [Ideonella]|uniref:phenol hydroxylase subunit n=1 Tax=Ideonella TaxID=36862 RepID=UPI000345DCA4|nr:phenol hydroxylase subunit [Ideonella sp. B508-1]